MTTLKPPALQISSDKYLSKRRGMLAQRNGGVVTFSNQVDLQIKEDFSIRTKERKNIVTVQFDMFNFSNSLNRNWAKVYSVPFEDYALINRERYTFKTAEHCNPG